MFKCVGFNPLLKEFMVGTQAIAGTESRNNGGVAGWLIPRLFLKQSRTICPGMSATHSELGPLTSINNQGRLDCHLQICAPDNLIWQVSQLRHSSHETLCEDDWALVQCNYLRSRARFIFPLHFLTRCLDGVHKSTRILGEEEGDGRFRMTIMF